MARIMGMDKNWQAESDMQALQAAQAVMCDPKRLKAAQAAAVRRVKELLPVAAGPAKATKKATPSSKKRLFG